jgi:hypothetical protein
VARKKQMKTKPKPWSNAALPYKVRSNWPKIAEAMAANLRSNDEGRAEA